MNFHLHTGPGHHEEILIKELIQRKFEFTYSKYHPEYSFSQNSSLGNKVLKNSKIFNTIRWLIWGISSKISMLRKRNRHLNFIYPVYDFLTSQYINKKTNILFGWAQVSLITMKKIKQQGSIVILDYPIPHILKWQKLLQEESVINQIEPPRSLFSQKMVKRMLKEIELADYISIPSQFVANSFIEFGVPKSKLIFNSYGIDTTMFAPKANSANSSKLIVIFVGSIEYRKGIQYLLEAMDYLESYDVELRIVGTVHHDFIEMNKKYSERKNIKWLGQLSKNKVIKEVQNSNVMVMPSILEGLSLTILEAMACGIPVISTTNAGGMGVIDDFKEGFVIPIRDPLEISEKIKWCVENRNKLRNMGKNARIKSINQYSSTKYVDRFVNKILSLSNE